MRYALIIALAILLGLGQQPIRAQVDYKFEYGIAEQLPEVKMETVDGKQINLADFGKSGKITIFKVGASWALNCAHDLENTARMCEQFKGEADIQIVSISLDDNKGTINQVRPFMERRGFNFVALKDTNDIFLRSLQVQTSTIPYTVIIDHKGNVVYKGVGDSKGGDAKRLREIIDYARSKLPVVTLDELRARGQMAAIPRSPSPASAPVSTPAPVAAPTVVSKPLTPPPSAMPMPVNVPQLIQYNENKIPVKFADRNLKTPSPISIKSDQITLTVWDTEYEDGDSISLYINNKCVLSNYVIRKEPKLVSIKIDRNEPNLLIMYAHNEGTRPPNTCAISIYDGFTEKKMRLSSSLNHSDSVEINFEE